MGPSWLFQMEWNARNGIACKNEVLSLQKLKTSIAILLWSETKLSIVENFSGIY